MSSDSQQDPLPGTHKFSWKAAATDKRVATSSQLIAAMRKAQQSRGPRSWRWAPWSLHGSALTQKQPQLSRHGAHHYVAGEKRDKKLSKYPKGELLYLLIKVKIKARFSLLAHLFLNSF